LRISFNINAGFHAALKSNRGAGDQTMILCQCKGVTDATIQKLIQEGASTLQAIVKTCGAGRRCPPCRAEICSMLCRDTAGARYDAGSETACAA
jgi:bacterioferritin-associated ferredoxin